MLRDAVGTGMLSLDEFETRLDRAYSATSVDELDELVRWVEPAPTVTQPRRRRRNVVLALAAAVAVVGGLVGVAAGRSHASQLPFITNVDEAHPLGAGGQGQNEISVRWPAHTRVGIVQTVEGSIVGDPKPTVLDYTIHNAPVSYRAVACARSCDPNLEDNLTYGPWYRPQVGSVLGAPGPTVTATPSSNPRGGYDLQLQLGEHTGAPVIVVFRNGTYLNTVAVNRSGTHSELAVYDDAESSAPTVSYAAAACYSDCVPTAIQSQFAQTSRQGPLLSEPANHKPLVPGAGP